MPHPSSAATGVRKVWFLHIKIFKRLRPHLLEEPSLRFSLATLLLLISIKDLHAFRKNPE